VPTLACIIPVTGTTAGLETTLLSVLERRPDDCEVLVVLGTPYDDPYSLQGEVQFLDAERCAGLVDCINVGLTATNAPFIHVLANGFEATDGWTEQALAQFSNPRVASVTPAIYDIETRAQLRSAGVGYRSGGRRTLCTTLLAADGDANLSIGPSVHAAFYRKSALEALGRVLPSEMGDELADLDLALSLRRTGWLNAIAPTCKVLGPAIETSGSRGLVSGLQSERFFWRQAGAMGRGSEIVSHVPAVLGSLLRSTWRAPVQALGRFFAMCQFGNYRQYQQLLASATQTSAAVQSCLAAHAERQAEIAAKSKSRQVRIDEPHSIQPMRETTRQRSRRK
jgi:hypothetical protein